jgi:hypothetical protein
LTSKHLKVNIKTQTIQAFLIKKNVDTKFINFSWHKYYSDFKSFLFGLKFISGLSHTQFHFTRSFVDLTFGQKIKHKMKFDRRQLLSGFADKVAIKHWVSEQIGSQYIVPNIKILNDAKDLKFSDYSLEFVIKPSHGSGAGFFVHAGAKRNLLPLGHDWSTWGPVYEIHPDDLNINGAFINEKSARWLKSIYAQGIEYAYAAIPPKLIVEKYMRPDPIALLTDFRMYTFHGGVKFFRATTGVANNIPAFGYDKLGNPLNIRAKHDDYDFQGTHPVLPTQFEEMIKLAEILSRGVDFVRVDFYLIGEQIYFSEMTNFPLGGNISFMPESFEKLVTSYWKYFDDCNYRN